MREIPLDFANWPSRDTSRLHWRFESAREWPAHVLLETHGSRPNLTYECRPIKGARPELVLNLWNPFGFIDRMTDEAKAEGELSRVLFFSLRFKKDWIFYFTFSKTSGLIKEINNGRLAMLGLLSVLSASRVVGSVPALEGIIPSYDGNIMVPLAPFSFFG